MNHGFLFRFLVRWFVGGFGIWVAAGLLSQHISVGNSWHVVLVSGLVLAVINSILRPIALILSLPAIIFSLGLFIVVVNGFMVMLASWMYEPLQISNFWAAMLAGMIIGLVNYLVTAIIEGRESR
jgi:putative membrane protein